MTGTAALSHAPLRIVVYGRNWYEFIQTSKSYLVLLVMKRINCLKLIDLYVSICSFFCDIFLKKEEIKCINREMEQKTIFPRCQVFVALIALICFPSMFTVCGT